MIGRLAPLAILVLVLGLATTLPLDPVGVDMARRFAPPASDLPFGSDHLGRDLFARVVHGGLQALLVATAASALALVLGILIATLILASPGPVGRVLERVMDLALALPSLLLAVVFAAIVGLSGPAAALALGLGATAGTALYARGLIADAASAPHVLAADAIGATRRRTLMVHVVPHVAPTLLLAQSQDTARLIVAYAVLTFLGLGADTSRPDWGAMIWEYRLFVFDHPRLVVVPCMAIALAAWCFARIGDPKS